MEPLLAYVGLGANLGDPVAALRAATVSLGQLPDTTLQAVSGFYRSAPVDAQGPDFVNTVAVLSTTLDPHALLAHLHAIEARHARERPYRNAPRTLDLDLLLYGDQTIVTPDLTVPHPRMHERAFVLKPLADIAARQHVIPGRGKIEALLPLVADQRITRFEPD